MKRLVIAGAIALCASSGSAAKPASSSAPPGLTVPRSAVRTLHSALNGVDYQVEIFLPQSYESSGHRYGVLYVLDGKGMGPQVAHAVRLLSESGDVPPLIVVGIDTADGEKDRYLDLPTIEPDERWPIPPNRGAANFLRVVTREIKPFVDLNYRTDPKDTGIGGHSLGGFFSLYAVLHAPQIFQHAWISSPSMIWSDAVILKHEEALAKSAIDLPARVFADVGGMEDQYMRRKLMELTRTIGGRHYPSLRWQTQVVEGANHATVASAILVTAMYSIYGPPPREPDAAELASLAGGYVLPNGSEIRLERENGKLFLVYPDRGYERVELSTSAPDVWVVRPDQISLSITRHGNTVTSISISSAPGYGPGAEKAPPPVIAVPKVLS